MFLSHVKMMECLARDYPDKEALICEDRRLTYRVLNERVNRLGNTLIEMGVKPGDKVAVLNSNCVEMVESMYAVLKAGAILVPLNYMVTGESLRVILDDSDSETLILGPAFTTEIDGLKAGLNNIPADRYICTGPDEVPGYMPYGRIMAEASPENPGVTNEPGDIFNIIYSSGTTGLPKGIVHTHDCRFGFTITGSIEFCITSETVICNSTPLYHNGSFLFVLPTLYTGGTVVLMKKFDPRGFLELVEKEKVTHAYLVPTQYIVILAHPEFKSFDTSSLEILLSMAAPLSVKTKEEILANFNCKLYELYGVTEGAGTVLKPGDQRRKIGSVGKPLMGGSIRLVDDDMNDVPRGEVGEIVGTATIMMEGYYKKPDVTAQTIVDGWLRTGDLGKFDEEDFLFLVGRKKDMIISGGVNIYPEDIEQVMFRHPGILEVAVFAAPDPKWGETPMAAVVLKEGQAVNDEEIMTWTNKQLAKYQRISGVAIMPDLPRNPAGKVLKRELRDQYGN
ncbi:MAG: AMP-binding protein [Proteobacteria bacterium]|nr:AMP-binding protein [Pseudomonadota bacterium]